MNQFSNKTIFTYINTKKTTSIQQLCLKTWKKNLDTNYKIVVLTPENLSNYIKENSLKQLYKQENTDLFLDFLMSVILYNYGGIFLDSYTIMTNLYTPEDMLLNNGEAVAYYDNQLGVIEGLLISRKKSEFTKKLIEKYKNNTQNNKKIILNETIKEMSFDKILKINCENTGFIIEKEIYGLYSDYLHKEYYFTNTCKSDEFFKYSKGLSKLYDAIIPPEYLEISEKEFLKQDILLSHIFKKILKI